MTDRELQALWGHLILMDTLKSQIRLGCPNLLCNNDSNKKREKIPLKAQQWNSGCLIFQLKPQGKSSQVRTYGSLWNI